MALPSPEVCILGLIGEIFALPTFSMRFGKIMSSTNMSPAFQSALLFEHRFLFIVLPCETELP